MPNPNQFESESSLGTGASSVAVIETLASFKPEKILSRGITQSGPYSYSVQLHFPDYQKTLRPLEHVAGSQIHEGLTEAIMLAVAKACETGDLPSHFREASLLMDEVGVKYRKLLKSNSSELLKIRFVPLQLEKACENLKIVVEVAGFMEGRAGCILSTNPLLEQIIQSPRQIQESCMSDFVREVLGPIYKEDLIRARSVSGQGQDCLVKLAIAGCDKSQARMGVIPDYLLHESLTEALLLSVARSIQRETFRLSNDKAVDMEWFHANYNNFFLRDALYKLPRRPFAGRELNLAVRVGEFRGRDRLGKVEYKFTGDLKGSAACVLNLDR